MESCGCNNFYITKQFNVVGTNSHRYSSINPFGVETGETYASRNPPLDMVIDERIPSLSSPAAVDVHQLQLPFQILKI